LSEKPKDEEFKCRIGRLLVEVGGETKEIPIAICMLGDKIDVRVPDKKLLEDLFKKKEKEVK